MLSSYSTTHANRSLMVFINSLHPRQKQVLAQPILHFRVYRRFISNRITEVLIVHVYVKENLQTALPEQFIMHIHATSKYIYVITF